MILVASSTGKVGSEVVKALQKTKLAFQAASSDLERAKKTLGDDVKLVHLNYDDANTFAPALAGVDALFILHPQDRPKRIEQLRAFIDAAKNAGVKRAVVMSALGANRHADDGMYLLEQYVAAVGIETTVLRPNWFMQNFHTQDLQSIKQKNEIRLPSGDSKFTLIDTRDIAEIAVKILAEGGHGGKAYTLMGGEALTYPEIATLFSDLLGRPIQHNSPTIEADLDQMRERAYPEEMVTFMAWLFADIASGYTAQFSPDVEMLLGRPARSFRDYLRDYADFWR